MNAVQKNDINAFVQGFELSEQLKLNTDFEQIIKVLKNCAVI